MVEWKVLFCFCYRGWRLRKKNVEDEGEKFYRCLRERFRVGGIYIRR